MFSWLIQNKNYNVHKKYVHYPINVYSTYLFTKGEWQFEIILISS